MWITFINAKVLSNPNKKNHNDRKIRKPKVKSFFSSIRPFSPEWWLSNQQKKNRNYLKEMKEYETFKCLI